jgi:sortase A
VRPKTRRFGTVLIVGGLVLLAYAAAVYFWRDPVTDLYQRYQQHQLSSELDRAFEDFRQETRSPRGLVGTDRRRSVIAGYARRFGRQMEQGDAIGRIRIPEIDVSDVVVHGTRWSQDLSRGPGHYERTSLPGLGKTVGIAGHRTTFGAPFRNIDDLERGDEIVLELPYGTFRYRVFAHEIVESDDWSVIRGRGFDTVMLSACHPLYSSSQRWIVYGRLVEVESERAGSYVLAATAAPAG